MKKMPELVPDSFRKKLTRAERQKYLKGKGKSNTWKEVQQLAQSKSQKATENVDQEIALFLPRLNYRQKQVILPLIKALTSRQAQFRQQLQREQRKEVKKIVRFWQKLLAGHFRI